MAFWNSLTLERCGWRGDHIIFLCCYFLSFCHFSIFTINAHTHTPTQTPINFRLFRGEILSRLFLCPFSHFGINFEISLLLCVSRCLCLLAAFLHFRSLTNPPLAHFKRDQQQWFGALKIDQNQLQTLNEFSVVIFYVLFAHTNYCIGFANDDWNAFPAIIRPFIHFIRSTIHLSNKTPLAHFAGNNRTMLGVAPSQYLCGRNCRATNLC